MRRMRRKMILLAITIVLINGSGGCASAYYNIAKESVKNVKQNVSVLPSAEEGLSTQDKVDAVINGVVKGVVEGSQDTLKAVGDALDKTAEYGSRMISETAKAVSGSQGDYKGIADDMTKDINDAAEKGAKEVEEAIEAITKYVSGFTGNKDRELTLYGPFDVKRVVDGDTFIIISNSEEYRVRLIGVDCPESVHGDETRNTAEGKEASEYTKQLLKDQQVYLEFDIAETDDYGRTLAYAYLPDGRMVQDILLNEGIARTMTIQPCTKYANHFAEVQKKAAGAGIGFWNGLFK